MPHCKTDPIVTAQDSPGREYGPTALRMGAGTFNKASTGNAKQEVGYMKEAHGSDRFNKHSYQFRHGDNGYGKSSYQHTNLHIPPRKSSIHHKQVTEENTLQKRTTVKERVSIKRENFEIQTKDVIIRDSTLKVSITKKGTAVADDVTLATTPAIKHVFDLTSKTESRSSTGDTYIPQDDFSEIYSLYLHHRPTKNQNPVCSPPRLMKDLFHHARLPRLYLIDDIDEKGEEGEIPKPTMLCTHDDTITEVLDMYNSIPPQDPEIPDVQENIQQLPALPLISSGSTSSASASDNGASSTFYITPSLRSWVNGSSSKEVKVSKKVTVDPYRNYFCFSLQRTIRKGDGKGCYCLGCRQDFNQKRIV